MKIQTFMGVLFGVFITYQGRTIKGTFTGTKRTGHLENEKGQQ
jgi:hypothetical protein